MAKKIIIHSHFYQPPRENPETMQIDDEPSAFPFKNWNDRITSECYRANAFSRYLDRDAHVKKIINNYKYMSFNFGPTLLSYLKEKHPLVVKAIKEADRESIELYGEGNAIAQSYNHTMLPLDDKDFARTQIRWALDDFKKFYGRKAKGFWCPECGISPFVIDLLYEEGIKFVILSPFQIDYITKDEKIIKQKELKTSDLSEPYNIKGEKYTIAAFFYNGAISSDISFAHLLRSADNFYERLLKESEDSSLVMAATDGEIYGHHEPFGDMAFAALTEKVAADNQLEFTNPSAYLKENPPIHTATLIKGEDNLGSSWSCSHGVSRWYKDCGCETGGKPGWNQKWRTPLRNALNKGREAVTKTVYVDLQKLGLDAKKTILNYIRIGVPKKLSTSAYKKASKLLEAYKWMSYSFTSCGWFFNDISGIETVHNIHYMLKALNMLSLKEDEQDFINALSDAKSNISEFGSGKEIAERILLKKHFKNPEKILREIEKDGLNEDNASRLTTALVLRPKAVASDFYFNAQNLLYKQIIEGKAKNISSLKYLIERLDLSDELLEL